ncbi:MAG: peptide-methionine (S)-S-oxide reductase [Verrucomicrobiales bacterium]|jgi:peptide-methionine (S)-S-oxide reductase
MEEIATFGAGCFWCVEAVFERLPGASDAKSGYMGGAVENPTYEAICRGSTGHAEVVQVTFDPEVLPFEQLLGWFWKLHDPTTLNRQGGDVGTQYRSAIFYHSEAQRETAETSKAATDASGAFSSPIATEITAAVKFWSAEGYHQDFFTNNPSQPYCCAVIPPKLAKLGLD